MTNRQCKVLIGFFCFLVFHSSPSNSEHIMYGKNYRLTVPNRFEMYVKDIRKFLDKMDESYHAFYSGLGLQRLRYTPLNVVGYPNAREFNQARGQGGFASGFTPSAYYSSFNDTAHVYNQGDMRQTLSSLLHEISHHYIREFIPEGKFLSPCLNEGLAELVDSSPLQASGMEVAPGLHLGWGRIVSRANAQGKLIPIPDLLAMNLGMFQALSAKSNSFPYAQCWAFTRFLMEADGQKWRPMLIPLLTQVEPQADWNKLIPQYLPYSTTQEEFQSAWQVFASDPR